MLYRFLCNESVRTLKFVRASLWLMNLGAGCFLALLLATDLDFVLPPGVACAYVRTDRDRDAGEIERLIRQIGILLALLFLLIVLNLTVYAYEKAGGWRGVFGRR